MTFATPIAFFLLVLLIPLAGLFVWSHQRRRADLAAFLSPQAIARGVVRRRHDVDFLRAALFLAACVLLVTALARPQWGERYEALPIRSIDLLFAVDTSRSMLAEDLRPNRLEAAKRLVAGIAARMRSDYLGLITFAGAARVDCPLTSDHDAFALLSETAAISADELQGTDFAAPFETAARIFAKRPASHKVLVLITDGEDQENRFEKALTLLRKAKVTLFTAGLGSVEGAPIPLRGDDGTITDWKKDREGKMVRSTLQRELLTRIATPTGGRFTAVTGPAAGDALIDTLDRFQRTTLSQRMRKVPIERYRWPLLGALLLLLGLAVLSERRSSCPAEAS